MFLCRRGNAGAISPTTWDAVDGPRERLVYCRL